MEQEGNRGGGGDGGGGGGGGGGSTPRRESAQNRFVFSALCNKKAGTHQRMRTDRTAFRANIQRGRVHTRKFSRLM